MNVAINFCCGTFFDKLILTLKARVAPGLSDVVCGRGVLIVYFYSGQGKNECSVDAKQLYALCRN